MPDVKNSSEMVARNGAFTILVVEDDFHVRNVIIRILLRLGYQVLQAESGEQAGTLAHMYFGPIHVLLTDVVMPGMSGPKLAERLKRERPELKVLFMSGHDSYVSSLRGAGEQFIAKPFTAAELAGRLHDLLE